ncbi:hypothetical protein BDA96_09G070800 [Sorghum bicolor]|uniref:Uncharacterized protein n=2 Tax=Sorghum bicolor TaxID=4558 RepID=A0A921U3T5_SORBI|nr:uncharacterized protein LOC8064202 [Sorghum bicolor]XP_021303757.1 uncharacterized protein LOC8064202 [Sorghum bicolor]KAG0517228.1 hypothetical protein BDA96_09G070800 [Sorghum bicolor]|eukprot:XP_002439387.1 uncharacterized protein LOC8064202 [Sorghum bicolor]
MAMATKNIIVTGNTATPTVHAKCSGRESAADDPAVSPPFSAQLRRVCGHCLRAAAVAAVGYSFAATAWRVRHDTRDLAFVAAAASLLAALLACLRRAERLTPDSPAAERRRVQAAVWALSTALSCAFAYRVAAVMPPPLAVLVWCMTALVALVGLYLLVLCRDQQYQALTDDDAAVAGDRKESAKISPSDELV